MTITDEKGHTTTQTWEAFGNPADAVLRELADAAGQLWKYEYNHLGSLIKVESHSAFNVSAETVIEKPEFANWEAHIVQTRWTNSGRRDRSRNLSRGWLLAQCWWVGRFTVSVR